jgi:CMP/dCMP kinase
MPEFKGVARCAVFSYILFSREFDPVTEHRLVIAIDGPAASGKSTTARLAAGRLGYIHVDTGAMYRAVTLKVLRAGIAPEDATAVAALLPTTHVQLTQSAQGLRVLLDGEDVSDAIRTPAVTRAVSAVSSQRLVREAMVREQRLMGKDGGIVLEGRDIGTVVFPDADLKFFMVAGIRARAQRRQEELAARGEHIALEGLEKEIAERDARDASRTESPLRRADDAIDIDTSDMSIEEQVAFVVKMVEARRAGGERR